MRLSNTEGISIPFGLLLFRSKNGFASCLARDLNVVLSKKKTKTSVEGNERLTSGKEVQENFYAERFLVYGAVGIVACSR